MNTDISIFNYNDTPVSFKVADGTVLVNATQMAAPFGKKPSDWLKTKASKELINSISEVKIIDSSDLVQVTYGDNGCTMMHEDVALAFAQWLAPKFYVWCNDRIKELLSHGITATSAVLERTIADPDYIIGLATALKQERAARAQAQLALSDARAALDTASAALSDTRAENEELRPKAEYRDKVLQSESLLSVRQIAKDFGKSATWLNIFLADHGIQFRQGRQWILHQKYAAMGLARSVTATGSGRGSDRTFTLTKWTEKGREFIYNLLKAFGYHPVPDMQLNLI